MMPGLIPLPTNQHCPFRPLATTIKREVMSVPEDDLPDSIL